MTRFATDENFNGVLLKALRSRLPEADIVRVQDTAMYQADDATLLAWLAQENRVLLTHDLKTMPPLAYDRVRDGLPMPGLVEVRERVPMAQLLNDLEVVVGTGKPNDFENIIVYIPF